MKKASVLLTVRDIYHPHATAATCYKASRHSKQARHVRALEAADIHLLRCRIRTT